jgi:hypothetical protein
MAHDEFPELTHQAKCVLMSTMKGDAMTVIDVSRPYWDRRFAAAVIREAIEQASPDRRGSCKMDRLGAIADNLHALPPPPPTREEMEGILQDLSREFGNKLGPGWTSNPFEELKAGIAHHCKEQP